MITIAGGGLAGLSLGIALRRRGIPVTLHEAGSYPRHRVCGEFVSGVSSSTLAALGISSAFAGAFRPETTLWRHRGQVILVRRLPRAALGISRYVLDDRLRTLFSGLGGVLEANSRLSPSNAEGLVWCAGRTPGPGSWIGLKCHVRGLRLEADLEMHLGDNGYIGLAGIEDGTVNVCGLFRLRPGLSGKGTSRLGAYLEDGGLGDLWRRIRAGRSDEDSFLGVAGFRLGWQESRNTGASVGDAAAMIPPFTGNGMSMAFESAETAVVPLVDWSEGRAGWERTVFRLRNRCRSRFAARMFLARAAHPFLTTRSGQAFLAAVSRSGFLPFNLCFGALR